MAKKPEKRRGDYLPRDAFDPKNDLPRSVLTIIDVNAPFRKWSDTPTRVAVPWGKIDYWNVIGVIETIGADEPDNFADNKFLNQEISIEEAAEEGCWLVRGRCFFSFWTPPAAREPGIGIRVRFLATLK